MSTNMPALLEAIGILAERLPESAIEPLATALAHAAPGAWPAISGVAQGVLATPHYREQVGMFIAAWQTHAAEVPPASVALALRAVAHTVAKQRRAQTLELVWTGPASTQPLRRTAQVLQELIDEAERELLIISFAVYDIPEIGQALLRAARRSVQIRLVIESPKESIGKIAYDSLAAFGEQVAIHAQLYRWPADKRPTDEAGRHGSLHAKCAVVDEQTLLISSANLTHYALNLNMELGLLLRGGSLPGQVSEHFRQLVRRNVLVQVRPAAAPI